MMTQLLWMTPSGSLRFNASSKQSASKAHIEAQREAHVDGPVLISIFFAASSQQPVLMQHAPTLASMLHYEFAALHALRALRALQAKLESEYFR